MRTLDRANTMLVVIDVQEAFRPAVKDFDKVVANTATLIQGARALDVPILVTEQYPKGLGHTVPEIAEHLHGLLPPVEKSCFSAVRAPQFDLDRHTKALLCGIEAHVCVSQTAHDLLDHVEVHVAADAVTSRTEENRQIGLHKMEQSGAVITSVETALFEMLGEAGSDEFKQVQRLVK